MWTQLAIATVSTMMGAAEEGAVIGSPAHPPSPTAVMTANDTTNMIARVPLSPRVRSRSISAIAAKPAGTRVLRSFSDTSMNVWLKITSPVRLTSISGNLPLNSSAICRADSAARLPSRRSSTPGSCTSTLMPATVPSFAMRRAARRGSERATSRMCDRLSASLRADSSTRSRTRMSSPPAVVCWKFVRESTRVA